MTHKRRPIAIGHLSGTGDLRILTLLRCMIYTNKVYCNDVQGKVYQNCKFHDPRDRGSCARACPLKLYSENALFL